jgi:heat-inducible transcriptional repressor
VARTVRLLAQITGQVAVVQYPSLTRSAVRHVEIVPLTPTRVMLVLITNTGRVEQRMLETRVPVSEQLLSDVRSRLNASIAGVLLSDAAARLADLPAAFEPADAPVVGVIVAALLETLVEQREERLMLAGTANLARFGQDFPLTIRPVLEALEEHVVLLRLLGDATDPSTLQVLIGSENPHEALTATSVVSSGYGTGERAIASLGVLGPTRMNYPSTMGAVRAVARYVGRILAEG